MKQQKEYKGMKDTVTWSKNIQSIVDEIDRHIKEKDDALTLKSLAGYSGYSEFHISRKFKEISGMPLRDYMRMRKLAFALKELRDTQRGILDIALDYGFSSHEAFTRAFEAAYGLSPSVYRAHPSRLCCVPYYVLSTVIF